MRADARLSSALASRRRIDATPAPAPAELVFHRGAVYTVDGARSWAEAVAVSNGRIVFVGTDATAKPWIGPRTKVVDLAGKMLLPAFHDSHVHPISGGIEALECDLHGLETARAVLEAVRAMRRRIPGASWIRGGGLGAHALSGRQPVEGAARPVVPDRPALLDASDGHSAWANSKALALAGVTKATPDPPTAASSASRDGGAVGRAARGGGRAGREASSEANGEGARGRAAQGAQVANGFGLTSLQEASASEGDLGGVRGAGRRRRADGARSASITATPTRASPTCRGSRRCARSTGASVSTPTRVKIFADGVLETRTAAVLEPYLGYGTDRGKTNLEARPISRPSRRRSTRKASRSTSTRSATGRSATRSTRSRRPQKANGVRDARHHIAHLELIDPPTSRASGGSA